MWIIALGPIPAAAAADLPAVHVSNGADLWASMGTSCILRRGWLHGTVLGEQSQLRRSKCK